MTQSHETTIKGVKLPIDVVAQLIDALPLPIFVKDQDSKFILSNAEHRALTGASPGHLLGKTTAFLHGDVEAALSRERDLEVLESGAETVVRKDYVYPDGRTSFLETRKARLTSALGEHFILGINIDLTVSRQNEEHLRALTGVVPMGIIEVRENEGIVFNNSAMRKILHVKTDTEARTIVERWLAALGPGFLAMPNNINVDADDSGNGSAPCLLLHSTGWIEIPYREEKSSILTLVDLTEVETLRRDNEEVSRLNAALQHSNNQLRHTQDELVKKGKLDQLGQLTATVAHELRNPLGAVRTSAFLLERKLKGQHPEVNPQFERINNGIKRCDDIITQLLDFARTKTLKLEPHDLDDWLSKLLAELATQFPANLIINLVQGLDGRMVDFDPERMRRAVVNTVQNAVEAMLPELPQTATESNPHIAITTREMDGKVWVEIADIGPGMSEEILAKIREPLFTTKNFGTGLGLPAVEKILEQHGGGLDIVSQPGQGTTVTLWWVDGERDIHPL